MAGCGMVHGLASRDQHASWQIPPPGNHSLASLRRTVALNLTWKLYMTDYRHINYDSSSMSITSRSAKKEKQKMMVYSSTD